MIVIVTGMHRSGTSALAGVLHHNGIIMGNSTHLHIGSSTENAKGFYENSKFRAINDTILRSVAYKTISWNPSIPLITSVSDRIYRRMEEQIYKNNNTFKNWGWKDPRNCLTLYVWLGILRQHGIKPKVVISQRPLEAIASSLNRRRSCSYERGLDIAIAYYERLLYFIEITGISAHVVDFNTLCTKPKEEVEKLSSFFDMNISNTEFIDNKLKHY